MLTLSDRCPHAIRAYAGLAIAAYPLTVARIADFRRLAQGARPGQCRNGILWLWPGAVAQVRRMFTRVTVWQSGVQW
jgi:hypothetical protein